MVELPAALPQGLAGLVIDLDDLEMDWDGTVRNIQAGMDQAVIKLAGFTTRIEDLPFPGRVTVYVYQLDNDTKVSG